MLMSEDLLIRHCSPTLAGIKTGNLFSCVCPCRKELTRSVSAEYILIHTFAHLIINQLSFDCGYGSSSIRERIYCEKTSDELGMYGLLIYTASGDSEGSLGGLVRQGEAGRLEDIIVSAIENASWCTSDPICIQSARLPGPSQHIRHF